MSDNFFDPKENNMEDQNPEVAEKIKIGDEEFTPEEAQSLVKLGRLGRELEDKWNTKIESIYPEFTKKSQQVKDYETKLQELEAAKNTPTPQEGDLDEDTIKRARQEARKIGIVTEDAFDEYIDKVFNDRYLRARSAEKMLDRVESLEKELDGSDGRPRFEREAVIEYMRNTGANDPEVAYKLMHEQQLDAWKAQQLQNAKREGIYTENASSAGGKQPAPVKATAENLSELVAEALRGGN